MESKTYVSRALIRLTFKSDSEVHVCVPGWNPQVEFPLEKDSAPALFAFYDRRNKHSEFRIFAKVNLLANTPQELAIDFDTLEDPGPYMTR